MDYLDCYWDCKCDQDYIHPRWVTKMCHRCGAVGDDRPDSQRDQVLAELSAETVLRRVIVEFFAEANRQ